ncbi:MAG: hypothetical protein DWQ37_03805 [Planctomycetota bacterium]|nr:MAG: hypothetical protein DWQ37_03805 [Planctomycetota bacterium]
MSETKLQRTILVIVLWGLSAVSSARAGGLIVAGDHNIGNPIDGSFTAPVDPGNALWFANILGGGTTVKIQDELYTGSNQASTDSMNTYYSTLPGVTSSLFTGTITPGDLAGVDLFFSILPSDDYDAGEISALSDFLNGGGTLVFIGDNATGFGDENARINAALTAMGSGMQLGGANIDVSQFFTTTNIAPGGLNTGVTSFSYNFTTDVIGGTPLFGTVTDDITFVAYEVPEPAAGVLLACGLVGLACVARRRAIRS